MKYIVAILLAFIQSSAQPAPVAHDSWLHPTDAAYRTAIQEGFTGKAKPGPYNEGKDGVHQVFVKFTTSRDERNVIVFFSPLRCSQLLGLDAREKLLEVPVVSFARNVCDGKLYVSITYSSGSKADSFPLVIEHEGVTVRPGSVEFTESPDISVYRSGSYFTDYTYRYTDQFFFKLAGPWTDNVKLRYVIPENGNPAQVDVDFSIFAKDEAAYRVNVSPN
jgi:hypothetical protein